MAELDDIAVSVGTADPGLPASVKVMLDDGVVSFPVVWNTENYNWSAAGTYRIEGALTLPSNGNITNSLNLKVYVNVIVG